MMKLGLRRGGEALRGWQREHRIRSKVMNTKRALEWGAGAGVGGGVGGVPETQRKRMMMERRITMVKMQSGKI